MKALFQVSQTLQKSGFAKLLSILQVSNLDPGAPFSCS